MKTETPLSTHTPGPDIHGEELAHVMAVHGKHCDCYVTPHTRRLIAAAPRMLENIKAWLGVPCEAISLGHDCDEDNLCGVCNRAVVARAILRDVEG